MNSIHESARDNAVMWVPGSAKGHVESFFMKFNDLGKGIAVWLKFTIYSPKGRPEDAVGEVWAIFFDAADPENLIGLKESYPIRTCTLSSSPVRIVMGDNVFEPPRTEGLLRDAEGTTIAWDLFFTEGAPSLHHFPSERLYTTGLPKSKAKSPHPDSRFRGWVSVGGTRVDVDDVPGMQGHNWGQEHAHHYAWGHCNAFENKPGAYFEGIVSKVKIGPVVSNFFSLAFLFVDGRMIRFNSPLSLVPRKTEVGIDRWSFEIRGITHDLEGELEAPRSLFTVLPYYNPDGALSYCINSKIADIRLRLLSRPRGRVEAELHGKRSAALEICTKEPRLFGSEAEAALLDKRMFSDLVRLPSGSWGLRSPLRNLEKMADWKKG